ncbi:MAG: hypothetical protein ACLFR7_01700 [Opitutales bacterium]
MQLRKSKKASHPLWRPDFRDVESLPDIKVIRTDFLLNLVCVSLALILLGYFFVQEYRAMSLQASIESLSGDIRDNAAINQENLRMSAAFRRLEGRMEEFVRFHNVPVSPDELLTDLARMQPDPVTLASTNFTGGTTGRGNNAKTSYTLILSGSVAHTLERAAPQVITSYRASLEEVPSIAPYFESSELSGFTRNDELGIFNFTIRITLRDTPRKADAS